MLVVGHRESMVGGVELEGVVDAGVIERAFQQLGLAGGERVVVSESACPGLCESPAAAPAPARAQRGVPPAATIEVMKTAAGQGVW